MVMPLVPLFSVSLGATPLLVGAIVAVSYFVALLLAIPLGSLVDSLGARKLIGVSTLAYAAAALFVAVFPGFGGLLAAQVILGASHLLFLVSAQTYVASYSEGQSREQNFGLYTSGVSLGQLIGPPLAGLLIDKHGFEWAFGAAGLTILVAFAASRFLASSSVTRDAAGVVTNDHQPRVAVNKSLRMLLSGYEIRTALLASCGTLFALAVFGTFVPVYLEGLSLSATTIGLMLSVRALSSMLVRPFMPLIVKAIGSRHTTLWVMVLATGLGLGPIGFVESVWAIGLFVCLVGVGAGLTQPLTLVIVAENVLPQLRGYAMGVRLTGNRLAQMISPLAIGAVAGAIGFGSAFVATSFVLGLIIFQLKAWGAAARLKLVDAR